ncbi:hypothetical protein VZT92_008132 [Zoarces viviparus]|uniref:Uncharacterized protein n=1 Tax=Zoarces viviparus TaxID=48416 RepID=A0AAW1FM51_ZOAVI
MRVWSPSQPRVFNSPQQKYKGRDETKGFILNTLTPLRAAAPSPGRRTHGGPSGAGGGGAEQPPGEHRQ